MNGKTVVGVAYLCVLLSLHSSVYGILRRNPPLVNNIYEGLLIAVHPDIPENSQIIDRIREFFTEASASLFRATNRRAKLGKIKILIPKTWSEVEYSKARTEGLEQANVVVQKATSRYGDSPYVKQILGCGKPGQYMHLTPGYLLNVNESRILWGDIGKTLVHELGHLLWGLHEEYVTFEDDIGHYYVSSISMTGEPVKCTRKIAGQDLNIASGTACTFDPVTSLPESSCRLHPDYAANNSKASLMFYHFLDSVETFCDNDASNSETFHNMEAPNRQNRLCRGKSSWEVMRDHSDFKDNNNPGIPTEQNVSTVPTFEIFHQQDRKFILAMDISDSMLWANRLLRMNRAAQFLITELIPDQSYVGLVDFYRLAVLKKNLTRITGFSDRQAIVDKLQVDQTFGYTCIGCGLKKSVEELKGNYSGAIIIVISDGEENAAPYSKEVIPDLQAKGILVDTVLVGNKSDNALISLASKTGGNTYYIGDDMSTDLEAIFTQMASSRGLDFDTGKIVQLLSKQIHLNNMTKFSEDIYIDASIGIRTQFMFTWEFSETDMFSVKLIDPDGIQRVPNISDVDSVMKLIKMSFSSAKPGKWSYIVNNTGASTKKFRINCLSRSSSLTIKPLNLEVQVNANTYVNFSDSTERLIPIMAELTKAGKPVVGANITHVVEINDTTHTFIAKRLLDNGAGADIVKDDGVYSGYFTSFMGNHVYSHKVIAQALSETRVKTVQPNPQQSTYKYRQALKVDYQVSYEDTGPFNRTELGTFFVNTDSVNSSVDIVAPSTIMDLKIVATDMVNKGYGLVTLTFTAPGDDLDQGRVQSYDIRKSSQYTELQSDVTRAIKVDSTTQDIKPAGQTESFMIKILKKPNDTVVFFSVFAIDDSNNSGDASNIVSVKITAVKDDVTTTMQPAVRPNNQDTSTLTDIHIYIIVACAIVFLLVLIIIIVVIARKRRKKSANTKFPSGNDHNSDIEDSHSTDQTVGPDIIQNIGHMSDLEANKHVDESKLPQGYIQDSRKRIRSKYSPSGLESDRESNETMVGGIFIQDDRQRHTVKRIKTADSSGGTGRFDNTTFTLMNQLGQQDEMADTSIIVGFQNSAFSNE